MSEDMYQENWSRFKAAETERERKDFKREKEEKKEILKLRKTRELERKNKQIVRNELGNN